MRGAVLARVCRETDVIEPMPKGLTDRPYRLLKHLSNSLFLDQLLGDECYQYAGARQEFWLQHIREDRIRPVEGSKHDAETLA